MENKMKYLLTLTLFSMLLFFGCDHNSGITSPVSIDIPKDDIISYPPGADSIFIPMNLPPSEIPNLVASKVIDGQSGGYIEIYFEYDDCSCPGEGPRDNDDITLYARLDISPNAFNGSKEISMVLNNEIGTISFYPHIVFNTPANLDLIYSGIDLEGIIPNSVDFKFQNIDGSTEQLTYASIVVDPDEQYLSLDDLMINHFSRYGWTR